jgi:hypothetical protein
VSALHRRGAAPRIAGAPFFGENVTGDTYLLPCKAPREEWDSDFMDDEFVITAWWASRPPSLRPLP